MKNGVRWGILGTSNISETMAKAIQHSTSAQLMAVAGRTYEKAQSFSQQFSIPKQYGDYQSLLDDQEIDAVYIGLPNHFHKEWIIRSAEAGKHILCEKPFVASANEAYEVISVLEKSNVFCMEALMYRCHPFIKEIKRLIQNKVLGDLQLITATYTANIAQVANPIAGGSIRNLGCYPISLVRFLAEVEPKEVVSLGRLSEPNRADRQASSILKFENNMIAVVSTADDMNMFWQFDVYGTQGNLKILSNPWLPGSISKAIIHSHKDLPPQEIVIYADKLLYTYQIETVCNNVFQGNLKEHDGISLQDSLKNMIVLEKWLQQVST